MKFSLFRLYFPQGIHIGDDKPDGYAHSESFIRSDTLYAAITSVLAEFGEIPDNYQPEYTVSSLFPFTTMNGNEEYFFPRPQMRIPFPQTDELLDHRKEIKGFKWIGKTYLERILHGKSFTAEEVKNQIQESFFTAQVLRDNKIMRAELRERVKIPRERSKDAQPDPFTFEVLHFTEGSGLYFLASESGKNSINLGLSILKDRGLGTDRNLGLGHFSYKSDTMEIEIPENYNAGISLGLLLPDSRREWNNWTAEIKLFQNGTVVKPGYSLIKRGGWLTYEKAMTFRKGSVYMLEEGSLLNLDPTLKNQNDPIVFGKSMISLKPKGVDWKELPPVLRCGKSFVLPTKLISDV